MLVSNLLRLWSHLCEQGAQSARAFHIVARSHWPRRLWLDTRAGAMIAPATVKSISLSSIALVWILLQMARDVSDSGIVGCCWGAHLSVFSLVLAWCMCSRRCSNPSSRVSVRHHHHHPSHHITHHPSLITPTCRDWRLQPGAPDAQALVCARIHCAHVTFILSHVVGWLLDLSID